MNKISLSFLLLNRKINLTAANGTGETTGDENTGGDPIPFYKGQISFIAVYPLFYLNC
jgi:hypothetical protein